MADLLDDDVDEVVSQDFDPASLPLGTFAAFDVSDQPMWTTAENAQNRLNDDQKNAMRSMVDAAAKADPVARRIEVQGAWMLELLDRGFHRLKPTSNSGWEISGAPGVGRYSGYGIFGSNVAGGWYDTNVIGEKNDTIVSLLTREIAESTFFAEKPGDPDDETYAAAANCLKHFIAEDNKYGALQADLARNYCTDETAIGYTRPVADAQKWGYEDVAPDVVPETADEEDPDAAGKEGNRPKIRTVSELFGKLERKVSIVSKSMRDWQYCMLSREYDIASQKAEFPWIADKITAGDLGIAELKLDRLARQSINLSMQSNYATGDSLMRDATKTRVWFRPGFYMDESCPKAMRSWFWQTFPKGFLVVYSGGELAFARNESMEESLTEFHARTGKGQNRRALTESYAGPQMRVNVLVDLWDEFCRKEIPRVGLDSDVWNVDALRASSVRIGVFEPFKGSMLQAGRSAGDSMVAFPMPTHQATLPDFIMWLTGPLAEQLTHAQQGVAGSQDSHDPQQTATEADMKDENARSSFGESWKDILDGFAQMTTQAVAWNARVQPEEAKFDTTFPGRGRIQAQMKDLKMGSAVARADGSANFPESWSDRQKVWNQMMNEAPSNPAIASWLSDPRNIAAMKEFLPKNMILAGVDAVEKQQGEFDILLKTPPMDNPQFIQLEQKIGPLIQQGLAEQQQLQAAGQDLQPAQAEQLQQAQQMLQQTPQQISSVPVRPTDNHAVEALVTLGIINGPEGRRLASSRDPNDQEIFQNLNLHYQQHTTEAQKLALQNQQPIQPKTSITVAADKLPPQEQASALQKLGIAASPDSIQQDQNLAPHEITTTEKGVGPTGSEIERKTSVVGKSLS
ncbi:MAG TPA: hypothetical protein VN517_03680 [Terriglobales bacterium]|nr:hypothetical protein [Terriglobales bacterium]